MRLAIFVCLLLTCLVLTKAQSFRSSKVQEFLEEYPILIKYSDWIDIIENEAFGLPSKEYQNAQPKDSAGGKKVVKGKDGKYVVVQSA